MTRALRVAMGLCAVGALGGCRLQLIAPYDPLLDQTMSQVQQDTELFFNQLQASAGTDAASYEANKDFYVKTEATVRTLLTRAQAVPKSEYVAIQVKAIEDTLERTERQHKRDKVLGPENASGIRLTMESEFRSFFTLELALRTHVGSPAVTALAPATTAP